MQLLIFFSLLIAALVPLSTCQPPNQLVVVTDDNNCYMKTNTVLDKLNTCERQKCKDDSNRTNQLWTDEVKETITAMMRQQQQESKSQMDQLTSKLEKVDEMLRKMENQSQVDKIEATLELVKMQVQQNAHLIKLPECQRWLQTQNLNRTHFFDVEGKYFYFNKTIKVNWSFVREWCAERGMKMAMLKTQSQMDEVAKELKERDAGENYWVGASDVGQPAGQFRWADGTLVDETTWHNGTIYKTFGDSNETTCVDFGTGTAILSDDRCSHVAYILCQLPPSLAACL